MTLLLSQNILMLLLSQSPFTKSCVDGDPFNCRQTVVEGTKVPFSGQLMTPRRAALLAVTATQCQVQLDLEMERVQAIVNVDLFLEKSLRANDNKAAKAQKELLTGELKRAHKAAEKKWHDHPALWMTIGGVVVAATIGIAVAIINAINNDQSVVIQSTP